MSLLQQPLNLQPQLRHPIWKVMLMLLMTSTVMNAHAQRTSIVDITSNGQVYPAYLAEPRTPGTHPAVILLHSFRGLQEGYRTFSRELAARGYVVLAVEWQTFSSQPDDAVITELIADSATFLRAKPNVIRDSIGLTGFCAGGRYTMLMLPQVPGIAAGFAWYGFPLNGEPAAIDLVEDLDVPLYIVHGSADVPSPIGDIYEYAQALDEADAYFELKVYQGEPHGFMVQGARMSQSPAARNAFNEMVEFFDRFLSTD